MLRSKDFPIAWMDNRLNGSCIRICALSHRKAIRNTNSASAYNNGLYIVMLIKVKTGEHRNSTFLTRAFKR